MPILTIASATLLEAWRGRVLLIWVVALIVVTAIAVFVTELALSEHDRFRLVWLALGLRLSAVFIIAFFVAGSVLRERDEKRTQFILAIATSRPQYVFGKLAGAIVLASVFALTAALALKLAGGMSAAWSVSLLLELSLVAALSLFAAITLGSIVATLALVIVGYMLARAWPSLVYLSQTSVFINDNVLLTNGAELFARLLPRLDLYTRTAWLFESGLNALPLVALQTVIYGAILLFAALLDFRRRDL